ncbi:MAG: hypothetical protein HY719_04615 [Planctomycetes bacterium]|nr:hypothetical protein [Planctomycetota bacterium]
MALACGIPARTLEAGDAEGRASPREAASSMAAAARPDPVAAPAPAASAPAVERAPRFGVGLTAGAGRDNNVFLAEGARRADHFFHGDAQVEAEIALGAQDWLRGEVEGEQRRYFDLQRANETLALGFVEYEHALDDRTTAGVNDAESYTDVNFLDPQGNFFPRRAFRVVRHQPRGFVTRDLSRTVTAEADGGPVFDDAQEFTGRDSLDSTTLRARGALSWAPEWGLFGRAEYTFARRNYRARRNLDRDGLEGFPLPYPRLDTIEQTARLAARFRFRDDTTLAAALPALRAAYGFRTLTDNFAGYQNYHEHRFEAGGDGALLAVAPDPAARAGAAAGGGRLQVRAEGWLALRRYDHRPAVTGGSRLSETLFGVTLRLTVPLTPRWSAYAAGDLARARTNEPGFSYRRLSFEVGLSWRFESGAP